MLVLLQESLLLWAQCTGTAVPRPRLSSLVLQIWSVPKVCHQFYEPACEGQCAQFAILPLTLAFVLAAHRVVLLAHSFDLLLPSVLAFPRFPVA